MQPTGRNATSGVACTHPTEWWSGFSLTTRPDSSSYPPSFALNCTPQVNLAGVLRWSGNRRGLRRAKGAAPRASITRPPTLSRVNMCRFSETGNKSLQKKCNHSTDTTATSGVTVLRDFFVNCEHAVESKRVSWSPDRSIGRRGHLPSFRRSASERTLCRSAAALDVNRRKPLVPTLRVGTFFVPLRGALGVNRRKPLVPTLRVGTFFVPLRARLT